MPALSPHAGTRPDASMLVDVDELLSAYRRPPAGPVSFGTSGHRGTSLNGTFTEAHVLAISEAICRHRREQGITGPLFVARDTHALSEPAFQRRSRSSPRTASRSASTPPAATRRRPRSRTRSSPTTEAPARQPTGSC